MDQTGAPLSRVLLPVLLDASLRSGRKWVAGTGLSLWSGV